MTNPIFDCPPDMPFEEDALLSIDRSWEVGGVRRGYLEGQVVHIRANNVEMAATIVSVSAGSYLVRYLPVKEEQAASNAEELTTEERANKGRPSLAWAGPVTRRHRTRAAFYDGVFAAGLLTVVVAAWLLIKSQLTALSLWGVVPFGFAGAVTGISILVVLLQMLVVGAWLTLWLVRTGATPGQLAAGYKLSSGKLPLRQALTWSAPWAVAGAVGYILSQVSFVVVLGMTERDSYEFHPSEFLWMFGSLAFSLVYVGAWILLGFLGGKEYGLADRLAHTRGQAGRSWRAGRVASALLDATALLWLLSVTVALADNVILILLDQREVLRQGSC